MFIVTDLQRADVARSILIARQAAKLGHINLMLRELKFLMANGKLTPRIARSCRKRIPR